MKYNFGTNMRKEKSMLTTNILHKECKDCDKFNNKESGLTTSYGDLELYIQLGNYADGFVQVPIKKNWHIEDNKLILVADYKLPY
jgi:hypothetical protein